MPLVISPALTQTANGQDLYVLKEAPAGGDVITGDLVVTGSITSQTSVITPLLSVGAGGITAPSGAPVSITSPGGLGVSGPVGIAGGLTVSGATGVNVTATGGLNVVGPLTAPGGLVAGSITTLQGPVVMGTAGQPFGVQAFGNVVAAGSLQATGGGSTLVDLTVTGPAQVQGAFAISPTLGMTTLTGAPVGINTGLNVAGTFTVGVPTGPTIRRFTGSSVLLGGGSQNPIPQGPGSLGEALAFGLGRPCTSFAIVSLWGTTTPTAYGSWTVSYVPNATTNPDALSGFISSFTSGTAGLAALGYNGGTNPISFLITNNNATQSYNFSVLYLC